MDRRAAPRIPDQGSALLICLPPDPELPVPAPSSVRILERSAHGLRIETAQRLAPSTLVRLDLDDSLVLGEVAWCSEAGESYHCGLRMKQSLQHLASLRRLAASLANEKDRCPLPHP